MGNQYYETESEGESKRWGSGYVNSRDEDKDKDNDDLNIHRSLTPQDREESSKVVVESSVSRKPRGGCLSALVVGIPTLGAVGCGVYESIRYFMN